MTKIFAERLKEARLAAGLSQLQLSKKSGVSRTSIQNIEYEKHVPNMYTIFALADVLGVSLDWLVGRRNHESK